MEPFNYVRSHENAGINALIAQSHPGGVVLELGGGKHDRFAAISQDRKPLVMNVEPFKANTYGSLLVVDLNTLQDGVRDPRIREATEPHGGIGTIIASHVCADLQPDSVRAIIRSSIEILLEGGSMWVFYLGRNNLRDLYGNILSGAMNDSRREKELQRVEGDMRALRDGIDAVRGQCRIHFGALYPLARRDADDSRGKGWKPEQFFEKMWEWERRSGVRFALEEGSRDEVSGQVSIDAATVEWTKLSQQMFVAAKGNNQTLEDGWHGLLARRGQILASNKEWLKKKRKEEKKRK